MKKIFVRHSRAVEDGVRSGKWSIVAAALVAGSALMPATAFAADIDGNHARSWGGLWLGLGAGYSQNSYEGELGRDFCIASAGGSGEYSANSDCEASDGSVELSAGAATPEAAAASAAAIGVDGSNSAAALGAATAYGVSPSASASASVNPSIPDANEDSSVNGDLIVESNTAGVAATNQDGDAANVSTGRGINDQFNSARAANAAFYEPSSGLVGAASAVSVGGTGGTAEALAIGLSGLATSLSESEGGMAANVHMRFDHQTASNWVFGAELDLTATIGSDGRLSSGVEIETTGTIPDENFESSVEVDRNFDVDTNMLASVRLRLGYAMGDFMIYGTGGTAYTNVDATLTETGAFDGLSASRSQSESVNALGGVIGGGVSAFVADNAVVSLEGLYYRFDETIDFDGAGEEASVTLDDAFSVMMKFSIRTN
jgi:outer membrane immunogenic protein